MAILEGGKESSTIYSIGETMFLVCLLEYAVHAIVKAPCNNKLSHRYYYLTFKSVKVKIHRAILLAKYHRLAYKLGSKYGLGLMLLDAFPNVYEKCPITTMRSDSYCLAPNRCSVASIVMAWQSMWWVDYIPLPV